MAFSRGFKFALYGLAVLILAGSMYALAKPQESGAIPAVSENDHVMGNAAAVVTLIEYSDFQCPACAAFEPLVKEMLTTYGDNVRLVYRHFPLYTLHPNAEAAAFAAEAAAQQGKFWEMHDMLLDRQNDWSELADPTSMFVAYAGLLNLNTDQFTQDLTSKIVKDHVSVDVDSGNAANISATPTIYLNGTPLVFPKTQSPTEYFKAQIDAAIANATPAQTTP